MRSRSSIKAAGPELIAAYARFPTEADCVAHVERVRWRGRVACPYCESLRVTPLTAEHRHHCNRCNTSFSATVNTVFHRTHLPLQKWFVALRLLRSGQNVSTRRLARQLNVNRNTGWYVATRIRRDQSIRATRRFLARVADWW